MLSVALLGIGILVAFAGALMFLYAAFEESFLWALGCFLLAPVQLIFLIMHWDKAKKAFFVQLTGGGLCLLALAFGASDFMGRAAAGGDAAKNAPPPAEAPPAPAPAPRVVAPPPPDLRTRAQKISDECSAELGMLCGGKNGEKAQVRCLRANEDSLRTPCREAIAEPAAP